MVSSSVMVYLSLMYVFGGIIIVDPPAFGVAIFASASILLVSMLTWIGEKTNFVQV